MIPEDFVSHATSTEEWFQDLTSYTVNRYAKKGLITPSAGVTQPIGEVKDATGFLAETDRWFDHQRQIKGGSAMDTIETPMEGTYRERRYQHLSREEGVRSQVYDDMTGRPLTHGEEVIGRATVGVGFNMDDPTSPQRFSEALPGVDFDAVRSGKEHLSEAQTQRLFDFNVQESERLVATELAGVELPEHQRLALVSLAFNSPRAAKAAAAAYKEGGVPAAIEAIRTGPGNPSRRKREAAMFAGPTQAPEALPAAELASKSASAVDDALKLVGLHEKSDRDEIREYLRRGGVAVDPSRTPWCAAWVNAALAQVGIKGTDSLVATSFAEWGTAVKPEEVQKGDVLLQSRGKRPGQVGGHVGKATGRTRKGPKGRLEIELLSGNQDDSVALTWEPASSLMVRRAT